MSEESRPPEFEPEASPAPMLEPETAPRGRRPSWLLLALVAAVCLAVGAAVATLLLRARQPAATATAPPAQAGGAGMPGMGASPASGLPTAPGERAVQISPARQQLIGVRTAVIEPRELASSIRTVGTLAYDETRVAQVHTKFSGWVERAFVDYVGQSVRRNQPLFTIYSPDLVSTQTEYVLALRNKAQLEASSIPSTRAAGESLLAAARDRLLLWDIPEEHIRELEKSGEVRRTLMLHSPFDGVVIERNAVPGQYLTPEMTAFKIADLSTIWAFGAVFEYELPLVRLGQRAAIEFPHGESARPLEGKISFISPDVDPQTRRVRIRVELPNPGARLKPETYVDVVIHGPVERRLAIPREAVIDNGVKQYAIVSLPDGYFAPKEIRVGPPSDESYPLLGGLAEGDRVVTSAQFLVDSETNLQAAMQSMAGMPGMDTSGAGQKPTAAPKAAPSTTPSGGSMPSMPGMETPNPSPTPPGDHRSHGK